MSSAFLAATNPFEHTHTHMLQYFTCGAHTFAIKLSHTSPINPSSHTVAFETVAKFYILGGGGAHQPCDLLFELYILLHSNLFSTHFGYQNAYNF